MKLEISFCGAGGKGRPPSSLIWMTPRAKGAGTGLNRCVPIRFILESINGHPEHILDPNRRLSRRESQQGGREFPKSNQDFDDEPDVLPAAKRPRLIRAPNQTAGTGDAFEIQMQLARNRVAFQDAIDSVNEEHRYFVRGVLKDGSDIIVKATQHRVGGSSTRIRGLNSSQQWVKTGMKRAAGLRDAEEVASQPPSGDDKSVDVARYAIDTAFYADDPIEVKDRAMDGDVTDAWLARTRSRLLLKAPFEGVVMANAAFSWFDLEWFDDTQGVLPSDLVNFSRRGLAQALQEGLRPTDENGEFNDAFKDNDNDEYDENDSVDYGFSESDDGIRVRGHRSGPVVWNESLIRQLTESKSKQPFTDMCFFDDSDEQLSSVSSRNSWDDLEDLL